TPPPQPIGIGRADWAFWATGGAALGLFAAGGVSGYLALKKRHDLEQFVVGRDGTLAQRGKLVDQTERCALIADGLFIAGGVGLAAATLLLLLRDPETPQAERTALRLDVRLDPHRAQLALRGAF